MGPLGLQQADPLLRHRDSGPGGRAYLFPVPGNKTSRGEHGDWKIPKKLYFTQLNRAHKKLGSSWIIFECLKTIFKNNLSC